MSGAPARRAEYGIVRVLLRPPFDDGS